MTQFAQLNPSGPEEEAEWPEVLPVEDDEELDAEPDLSSNNGEKEPEQSSGPVLSRENWIKRLILGVIVLWVLFTGPWHRAVYIPLGSSMEPAFPGPCLKLTCPECQHSFRVTIEAASLPQIGEFRKIGCPNCGFAEVPVQKGKLRAGKPVRAVPNHKELSRGDVVIFNWPDKEPGAEAKPQSRLKIPGFGTKKEVTIQNAGLGIKRIAGLPGEKIEICRGEILADGKITAVPDRSHPEEIRLSSIKPVVRGDKIEWTHSRPLPYQAEEKAGNRGWKQHETVFPIVNGPENPRFERIPQSQLENVRDFSLHFYWNPVDAAEKTVVIAADSGETRWLTTLDYESLSAAISQCGNTASSPVPFSELKISDFSGKNVSTAAFSPLPADKNPGKKTKNTGKGIRVELRFFDRTASVWFDGKQILEAEEAADFDAWKKGTNQPISTPFALFLPSRPALSPASEAEAYFTAFGISAIGIYRDLTYSEPQKGRIFDVPQGEYLLLGDNSAVSIDARHWKKPTVRAESVRGVLRR